MTNNNSPASKVAKSRIKIISAVEKPSSGYYVIKHLGSGRVYVGLSNDLLRTARNASGKLKSMMFSNSEMQDLFDEDPRINIELYETTTSDVAASMVAELTKKYSTNGKLIINGRGHKRPPSHFATGE